MFGAHLLRIAIHYWWIFPLINKKWNSFSFLTDFSLKSALLGKSIPTVACLLGPFAWKLFFHPLTVSQYLFIYLFFSEMNLLQATYGWILYFNPVCYYMSFDWGIEATDIVLILRGVGCFCLFLVYWSAWSKGFILSCIIMSAHSVLGLSSGVLWEVQTANISPCVLLLYLF
jgi:hypothetical protein